MLKKLTVPEDLNNPKSSHLIRFVLILEQNELQWGDTACSITQYFKVHVLLEKDFPNLTFQKITSMQV